MALMIFRNMTDDIERTAVAAFLECKPRELMHLPTPIKLDYWNGQPTRVHFKHFNYGDPSMLYRVTGLMDGRIMYAADDAGAELVAIVSNKTQLRANRDWIEDTFPHLRGKLGDPSRFDCGRWWEEHPLLDADGPWMKYHCAG